MDDLRSSRPGRSTRRLAFLGVFLAMLIAVPILVATPVGATPLTGRFSPTIIDNRADLNGNNVVNGRDDANAFYGDTHIIDGRLDCDAWGPIANDGSAGDNGIDQDDDCSLVGYDGTPDGVTIDVENGEFQVRNGRLPRVFNAADPDNNDISDSDFAWSARDGRVDSNGDETITWEECHFGIVGETIDPGLGDATDGADILGNDGTDPCGFGSPAPNTADNGLVDLNDDHDADADDTCRNGCFFGHDVVGGKVQELTCPGHEGDSRNQVVGTLGNDVLRGTGRNDVICGLGGNDVLRGRRGADLLLGGRGADILRGGRGADILRGGRGNDDLFGGRGPDTLLGGRGRDFLNGGPGDDTCRGGPGRDTRVSC
jgi:Ca2+-binding RTX toxin-like protein